jgi:hypothetical protein
MQLEKLFIQLVAEHNAITANSSENGLLLSLLYQLGKAVQQPVDKFSVLDECAEYIVAHYEEHRNRARHKGEGKADDIPFNVFSIIVQPP